jgi:type IV secretion system protein VirB3
VAADPEPLIDDTLFLALTRPALWFGVPVGASVSLAMGSVVILMITSNPLYAVAFFGGLIMAARLIVRKDYNMFRLIFLWGQTKAISPNRIYWGGSSYTPLFGAGLKRKGFARG